MNRKQTKLVHAGEYAAEVDVGLIDDSDGWSPYLSLADAKRAGRSARGATSAQHRHRQPAGPRLSARPGDGVAVANGSPQFIEKVCVNETE